MVDLNKQDPLLEAIELFYFAYRAFTAGPDRILQEKSLGRVHHRILYFIARNPQININQLLTILDVSKQALNAPLRNLIDAGLIITDSAEHDRRIKQLKLSREGQKLETLLTSTQRKHLEMAFSQADNRAEKGWREVMQLIAPLTKSNA